MVGQGSRSGKKQKRDEPSDSDESEEELQSIHFFIPGEGINAEVLVEYIIQYVDRTAKITSSHHPTDKTRTGFNVLAKKTLNAVSLRDIINDSKDWDLETQSKIFRKHPYRYSESDTAKRRARQGASEGGTTRPAARQQQRTSSGEPTQGYRGERPSGPQPSVRGVSAQYGTYQSSQPHPYQRPPVAYYPNSSRPGSAQETYNIYNTMASTSYTANSPMAGIATYMPNPYGSLTYSTASRPTALDYPPPPYEQSNTKGPPRPHAPEQPDPDTFDQDSKPSTIEHTDMTSLPPGEEPDRSYRSQTRRRSSYEDMKRRPSHRE
ncbi:hypothetical protein A1O1_03483 [Capronia coronata CBS 617.96]|uniref:Uncharacterized protein n=1 Tax=Capronia coronata CBS 617.96 TaxID=1182541 RepID=W9YC08_9EURO|nr:uncharacterized protein A1O1_03483 [Capronia coronata CBS 617.96]EXJ90382.1 hypothetical protein A1O1_03483 [Capronia coronata CBS 617.96]